MCQYSVFAEDGVATPWHLVHYGGMAKGGAGGIIVEATAVVPEGRITARDLGLWSDEQAQALVPTVDFVHSQGATVGVQLAHAGRKASTWPAWGTDKTGTCTTAEGGWETVAPSAIACPGLDQPRELTLTEIKDLVNSFRTAARRAVSAGFDFVEIHGAHGYLLHEFLSPLSNHREDQYGGGLENRARFLLEIVAAVRDEVGENMPVLVRLSATDWIDGGITLEDTIQVVRWLREASVDLVDVSTAGLEPADIPIGPGYQVYFAQQIREQTDMPVATVGLITEAAQAEQILASEQADVVLFGRKILADPNFPLFAAKTLGYDLPYLPGQYVRAF